MSFPVAATVAISVGLIILASPLVAWLFLRHNPNRRREAFVSKMIFFYLLASFLSRATERIFEGSYIFIGPLADVFGLTLSFVLAFVVFRRELAEQQMPVDFSDPDELKRSVHKILDSDSFLTALRTTLPEGKTDKQFGLDYIPFMLHSIDERRARVTNSARWFLFATILTATLFAGIVGYFGYILVNENASGSAKYLSDIKDDTTKIKQDAFVLLPTSENPAFQKDVLPSFRRLAGANPGPRNSTIDKGIHESVEQAQWTGSVAELSKKLSDVASNVTVGDKDDTAYFEAFNGARSSIQKFMDQQSMATQELSETQADLKSLISEADKSLSDSGSRNTELLRRLSIGIVVSTFFLALLRYLGNLYRTRYEQVVEAERDDFMVRRFYVALKNSYSSEDQRKIVLSSFMAGQPKASVPTEAKGDDDSSKQAFELIKEMVAALSKKL